MPDPNPEVYFPDVRARAVFAADGPRPQFLIDRPDFKALVVGLEAGQRIPLHPGDAAVYHFLEGQGEMLVGDERYALQPGVTVAVPEGFRRGINARTRVIFLAARCATIE